ncbi:MAG: GNAT family N-acetyltransferase [Chloroflexota bacterium]|nr:GNAT family N-acetyltransferase [Chloroflexota bacterium]
MPRVRIRAAQASDRADVAAICGAIWPEDDDYVPKTWDDWLADPDGELVVAEWEGRVVGFAKLTHLTDEQWWLEGLRVAPEHQRRGIAGELQAHLVEVLRQKRPGTLRFATHSGNEPVHRLAARDGFRHVATYRLLEAEAADAARTAPLRRLGEADLDTAWNLIEASPRRRAAEGLYETFWSWETLTRERLTHHLSRGDAWGIDAGERLAALALVCQTDKEDAIDLGYVDGRRDEMETHLLSLRGLAARRGCDKVRLRAVDEPELIRAAEGAGYEPSWERDLWIFELSHHLPSGQGIGDGGVRRQGLRRAEAQANSK